MITHIKYIARFWVQSETPLVIGSGRSGLYNEKMVTRDANGLPYLPGSAIAGVIQHELRASFPNMNAYFDKLFGFQDRDKGQGSRLAFSSGALLGPDGINVLEGLQSIDFSNPYFACFTKGQMPERDHVRISHRGTAQERGKFETEVVPAGARFVFQIELDGQYEFTEAIAGEDSGSKSPAQQSRRKDKRYWNQLVRLMEDPAFRLGSGVRKGFGRLQVIACAKRTYELNEEVDLLAYLEQSSSLNQPLAGGKRPAKRSTEDIDDKFKPHWTSYQVRLNAFDSFIFGAGYCNQYADTLVKKERRIQWDAQGAFAGFESCYLLPATSIKGALAHRTAFHYNNLKEQTIEHILKHPQPALTTEFDPEVAAAELIREIEAEAQYLRPHTDAWDTLIQRLKNLSIDDSEAWKAFEEAWDKDGGETRGIQMPVGEYNAAIQQLFGYARNQNEGARGRVMLNDIYLPEHLFNIHYFNHVAIDRFTGGGRNGALFTEQAIYQRYKTNSYLIELNLYVDGMDEIAHQDPDIEKAWNMALDDLTQGRLALGGSVGKGHGMFTGIRS